MFTPQSGNLLLAAVPPEEFELIKGFFEPCQLRMRESLQEAGDEPDKIYFPTPRIWISSLLLKALSTESGASYFTIDDRDSRRVRNKIG
jgi:hypothetical protein